LRNAFLALLRYRASVAFALLSSGIFAAALKPRKRRGGKTPIDKKRLFHYNNLHYENNKFNGFLRRGSSDVFVSNSGLFKP
jgi:hypothetical protein